MRAVEAIPLSVPGHKGGLLTLVERKTQLAKIIKLPRATAYATQTAAVRRLEPIGDFVHTSPSTTERSSLRIRISPMP
jgi:IS30 family transposase